MVVPEADCVVFSMAVKVSVSVQGIIAPRNQGEASMPRDDQVALMLYGVGFCVKPLREPDEVDTVVVAVA